MSNICSNCFQDRIAQAAIKKSGTVGDCDFCESTECLVLPTYELRDLFEKVLKLYQPYEPMSSEIGIGGGATLAECMEGWEIFNDNLDYGTQNEILDEIRDYDLRDGEISAGDDWEAKSDHWSATPAHQRWPWFARHIKTERRFIIEDDPTGEVSRPEKWVPDLLSEANAVIEISERTPLFRGRLGCDESSGIRIPWLQSDMGAPPAKLAKAGRVNPEGIPFLYCAMDWETAIIEAGRFPGAVVSVRELRVKETLRLADLRGSKRELEPLATANLAGEVENATLLNSLGMALSEPIHHEASPVEYIPTQYLAEVIQSAGYDGICYPSALDPNGTNIVIFDPSKVDVINVGQVFELTKAEYSISPKPPRIASDRTTRVVEIEMQKALRELL